MLKRKKALLLTALILVLAGAIFALSPLFRNKTVNESLPVSNGIEDNLNTMDRATADKFKSETESMKDQKMAGTDSSPADVKVLKQAEFKPRAHDVAGKALLIETNGKKYIRFENFSSTNGPDVRIYLSSALNNKDYVDLGALKATDGNVNYEIPTGTDTDKYESVLVWCRAFSVLFSYAELQ